MSYLRFNHVFYLLMLLAALSAFFFPPRVSQTAQGQLQKLFHPISTPIYSLASWSYDKAVPKKVRDDTSPDHPREASDLIRENADLRSQIQYLNSELERLQELNADRERIGDLRNRCTPVQVTGGDAGLANSRSLDSGSSSGLNEGMAVICADGVIGRLMQVGRYSSRVKLITDKGNSVMVSFARVEKGDTGKSMMINVSFPDTIAVGQGDGTMLITNLKPWKDLQAAVKVDDWVILDDKEYHGLQLPRRPSRRGRKTAKSR